MSAAVGGGREQGVDVPVEPDQHEHGEGDGSGHQQDGLDDLDPGRRAHTPERHIDHHERSDPDHGPRPDGVARATEQQRDEAPRTHHLSHQVQNRDGDGGDAHRGTHRTLRHPRGDHVGEREPAAVAYEFGDQEQDDEPGHEESDGVEHAVVAVQGDEPRDAEEGRGGHVVTRDGESVLHGREEPSARVELLGRTLPLPADPGGDAERHGDEDAEQQQRQRLMVPSHRSAPLVISCVSQRSSRATRSRCRRA